MKNSIRLSLALAGALLGSSAFAATTATAPSGHVDFKNFIPAAVGEVVEVDINPGLLRFASKLAGKQEPEAAELIGKIQHVRVNVVDLDDGNRADAIAKIGAVRAQLEAAGWQRTVSVRNSKKGEDVMVFIQQGSDDAIAGIVVTVIENKKQAVFVNIVGDIRADQLASLGAQFNIKPLRNLIKDEQKAEAKEEKS
jgi:hypothetical protein